MISKTTPFTTVSLSPSGQLTLPVDFRFWDLQEVFVWREPMSGHVILSTDPPSMSVTEMLKEAASLPREDELLPGFAGFFHNMYPARSTVVRPRKSKPVSGSTPAAPQDLVA